MAKSGLDMYVFRDGRKTFAGRELRDRLASALARLRTNQTRDSELRALIAAGELECALRDAADDDARWEPSAVAAERLTNLSAKMFVAENIENLNQAQELLRGIEVPEKLSIAVLEGFAYYALHPMKFLNLLRARRFELPVAVIGIRSIGAPLSSVVAAELNSCERITVRPTGHPYERSLAISDGLRSFVEGHRGHQFIIVDEGPGLSGSSFLAVAEGVERCGVPAQQITMIGSRKTDATGLKTPQAVERWPRFQYLCTEEEPVLPESIGDAIGGGYWRRQFLKDFDNQPASWTQLEMSKYLSVDRKLFFKFEGFGHFGDEIGERSMALERLGFGPRYKGSERGFGTYEVLVGDLLSARDASADVLNTISRYCATRSREFSTTAREESKLPEMLVWNWECEFGESLPKQHLEVKRLVTADARMLPHEWIVSQGRILKLDANSHGDDHFFPGPCDIAWDIAGVIVEWDLDRQAGEYFVDRYVRESGDNVRPRLGAYLLAYATFRMGWSKMAAQASAGEFDQQLLERDYRKYRDVCTRLREVSAAA